MADKTGRPYAQMRLHGENGKVYVVDSRGAKLWLVNEFNISVSEDVSSLAEISIKALGTAPKGE